MHIYAHAHTSMRTYPRTLLCTYLHTDGTHVHAHIHAHSCTYMHVHIPMHTDDTQSCMYMHTAIHSCTCMHTHMYMHTHAHICAHVGPCPPTRLTGEEAGVQTVSLAQVDQQLQNCKPSSEAHSSFDGCALGTWTLGSFISPRKSRAKCPHQNRSQLARS